MIVCNSFLSQTLDSLLTFNPICIYAETTLDDLLERLYSTGFHQWPVINTDRQVIGIVDDRDIVQVALEYRTPVGVYKASRADLQIAVTHFMRQTVTTIDACATPSDVLETLLTSGLSSVPVTRNGMLWGVITISDYVREFAYSSHPVRQVPLQTVYDPTPLMVRGSDSLEEIDQQLRQEKEAYAVVMEGACPLGVVSSHDLRRHQCRGIARSLFAGTTESAARGIDIIKPAHVIAPKADLGTAAAALFENQAQALMVCNRPSELSGLITQEQILGHLIEAEAEPQKELPA